MPDRIDIIDHLKIIRTWAAVGALHEGIGPSCCMSVRDWIDETLDMFSAEEDDLK